VTKFELVKSMANHLGRLDIRIVPTETGDKIDRTLETVSPEKNAALWRGAGYATPPTVDQMVDEMIRSSSSL
jgi:hypothetical protein